MKNRIPPTEDIEAVVSLLRENGVFDTCIKNMSFKLTNSKNIKASIPHGGSVCLIKKQDGFKVNDPIPESWHVPPFSEEECDTIKISHPQRNLINKLNCEPTVNGIVFNITPQADIPFDLSQEITIDGKSNEEIRQRFTETNLILGPSEKIANQAYDLIHKSFARLVSEFKELKIPKETQTRYFLDVFEHRLRHKNIRSSIDNDIFYFKFAKFSVSYNNTDKTFSDVEEPYSKLFEKIKNSQKVISSTELLMKELRNNNPTIQCKNDFDSSDCSAILTLVYKNISKKYKVHSESIETDIQQIRQANAENIKEDETITRQKDQKLDLELRQSSICGNLVAECIYSLVSENMKRFRGISTTAILKKVRGLSENTYNNGNNAGKFNMISVDEVSYILEKLLSFDILRSKSVSGEYCTYDKIILGDPSKKKYLTMRRMPDSFTQYNDQDWLFEIRNPSNKWKDKNIVCIFDHPAVYCVAPDLFVNYFSSAPDDVKLYINLMKSLADAEHKKLLRIVSNSFPVEKCKDDAQ